MDLKEFRGGLETYPWLSAATTVFLANSTPPITVRSSLTANMVTIGVPLVAVGLLNSLLVSVFVVLTRLPTDFEILSSSHSFLPYVLFLLQKTVLSNCSSTINTINEHSRMHNY